MLTNKTILITGGTGSFGNTFVPMTLERFMSRTTARPAPSRVAQAMMSGTCRQVPSSVGEGDFR